MIYDFVLMILTATITATIDITITTTSEIIFSEEERDMKRFNTAEPAQRNMFVGSRAHGAQGSAEGPAVWSCLLGSHDDLSRVGEITLPPGVPRRLQLSLPPRVPRRLWLSLPPGSHDDPVSSASLQGPTTTLLS